MRQPIKTFEDFRDALSTYRLPRVILTALELRLFTVMRRFLARRSADALPTSACACCR
jgi:hypothetical protein